MISDYDIDAIFEMLDKQIDVLYKLTSNTEARLIIHEKKIHDLLSTNNTLAEVTHNIEKINNRIDKLYDELKENPTANKQSDIDGKIDILSQQLDNLDESYTSLKKMLIIHEDKLNEIVNVTSFFTEKVSLLNKKAQISADFMKTATKVLSDFSSRISVIEDRLK